MASIGALASIEEEDLSRLHILRRVGLESVHGLLSHCPIRQLIVGETLLQAGQANKTMYMVLSGRLSVHLGAATEPVAFLDSGETVGEISVIDGSPVSAFVKAASEARLLAVDEETFWRLIRASHAFSTNLLALLAHRMRTTNSTVVETVKLRTQFEQEALADGLTQLNNRRWLNENLPRFLARHNGAKIPLSILMIDMDHFKRVNDQYGHPAGDDVLCFLAAMIKRRIRPTDSAARYGGEEFVVILPGCGLNDAKAVAENLCQTLRVTPCNLSDGQRVGPFTISIGVAEHLLGRTDAAELLARVDSALYRAKEGGRNRVELSAPAT